MVVQHPNHVVKTDKMQTVKLSTNFYHMSYIKYAPAIVVYCNLQSTGNALIY